MTSLTQPQHGTAFDNGYGTVIYTPDLNFIGQDLYTYTISDGRGGNATANVAITVAEVSTTVVLFSDSFETSFGNWSQDSQTDWFRSTQRATDGTYSAEVDGRANAAQLISIPIDLQGRTKATITFSWYIESSLDTGEYIAFDVSFDGGSTWVQKLALQGNVDEENAWHDETVEVSNIGSLRLRFRGTMSDSIEDADIDNVKVTAVGN